MLLTWIEISKKALLNNIAEIKKVLPKSNKFMAVIKANSYGHGLLEVAKIIENKVDYLAVFQFEDALFLRQKNIKKPILVLGRIFLDQVDLAIKNNIEVSVSTFDILQEIKKPLKVHICVDSGLGRDGFIADDLNKVLNLVKKSPLKITGIYAHFSAAEDKKSDQYSVQQIAQLLRWKKEFALHKIMPLIHHCASAGSLNPRFSKNFDMARIGISLYGFYPSNASKKLVKLQPALKWFSRISELRKLKKGAKISYNATYELKRDSTLATLPIGYYDGLSRVSSNKGFVTIKGKRAPQIGRVTMNLTVVDVTKISGVKVGDIVEIIGSKTSAQDWAAWSQTSSYEIVTRLNSAIKRIVK